MNKTFAENVKKKIDSAEVVSFDVFDTLIVRIVNTPETIFEVLGEQYDLEDFCSFRMDMQNVAGTKAEIELGWPHANMDQIYECIAQNVDEKYSTQDIDWKSVKSKEYQIEKDALKVNSEMYLIYQYAKKSGKRVIATSDMYLPSTFLSEVLEECGYKMDEIYDSADVHCTKWKGDLFEYVIEQEKVDADKLLHVGDNFESDVRVAASFGIQTCYYKQEHENKMLNGPLSSCIDLGISECLDKVELNFWENIGARVGGPLYIGLITWMQQKLESESYEKIFFLSRDGYNLYNLFKKYTEESVEYIHTSRRALLLAGINKLDDKAIELLPPYSYGQSVKEVLEYLGVLEIYKDQIDKIGFDSLDDKIVDIESIIRFKEIYKFKEKEFLDCCKEERIQAENYFRRMGFFDGDAIVFDCGWNGSSQYLLERFLRCTDYSRSYKFMYNGILDTKKSRMQLHNANYESYLFDLENNIALQNRVKQSIVLLELFFGAPEKSTYIYLDGKPVFEKDDVDEQYKEKIYSGIETYFSLAYEFVRKYNIDFSIECTIAELLRLIERPTIEEALIIGDIPNVDGFAKNENERKYIAKITEEAYENNPLVELWWIQGFLKRDDIEQTFKEKICKERNIDIQQYSFLFKKDNCEEKVEETEESKKIFDKIAVQVENNQSIYSKLRHVRRSMNLSYYKQEYEPLISVVVPVYNVIDEQLIECIESIREQTYWNWELILVDDFSSWKSVRNVLSRYENEKQITIIYRTENGNISVATNDGIEKAKGDYIAFIDCDDVIEKNAFAEMVYYFNEHPNIDFVYSDEDKLSEDGKMLRNPFFKPDWSPDTIFSLMYTNHLALYKTEIVKAVGGLRTEYNGAQDYDFTLRFMEMSDNKRVGHVPKVLYHWRERPESIASTIEAKPYAINAMKRLKIDAIRRRGIDADVEFINDMYQYRVRYKPTGNPKVSIVIPSKDNYDILKQCICSIKKYTSYANYEIIIVDNGSNEDNKFKIEKLLDENGAKYLYRPMKFNFSTMCNIGVSESCGEYILLLNDDIEVVRPDWLDRMLGQAMQEHTGAVGAKLYYPETNVIQHIGISNLLIGPSHAQLGFADNNIYYFGRNRLTYNWLAVTAACLMVSKDKYYEVNGLDENLTIAYNDVDFCFKLYEKGYYNVVRNDVCLYHHESISRGSDDVDDEKKQRLLKERDELYKNHPLLNGYDPFYNPNLTTNKVDFEIDQRGIFVSSDEIKIVKKLHRFKRKEMVAVVDGINTQGFVGISGWCASENPDEDIDKKCALLLKNEAGVIYQIPVVRTIRQDVQKNLKCNNKVLGFSVELELNILMLKIFSYQIGVALYDKRGKICNYVWTDKFLPKTNYKQKFLMSRERIILEEKYERCRMTFAIDNCEYVKEKNIYFGQYIEGYSKISGWSCVLENNNLEYNTEIVVEDECGKKVAYEAYPIERFDVATEVGGSNNYMLGFEAFIPKDITKCKEIYILKTNKINNKKIISSNIKKQIQNIFN